MKRTNSVITLTLVVGLGFSALSCDTGKSTNQEELADDHITMDHSTDHKMTEGSDMVMSESQAVSALIDSYLSIKNALAKDDSKAASSAAQKLMDAASTFELSSFVKAEQAEIKEYLEVIRENGEHITKSEIDHQRGHFERLSQDLKDLLEITGTDRTLYQQFCPMYAKGKGGIWLSESSEIKNPLFGSKMTTCGSVTETITMK
ncbi:MAG: hypothetical protein ACJA08_000796 [Cyclobacteriaceae bacterium]|jgi:hypothetical protein